MPATQLDPPLQRFSDSTEKTWNIKGLLHGYVAIKIWWTRVEVWLKNTRVSVANEFVFGQNLNESPSNLNLHKLP